MSEHKHEGALEVASHNAAAWFRFRSDPAQDTPSGNEGADYDGQEVVGEYLNMHKFNNWFEFMYGKLVEQAAFDEQLEKLTGEEPKTEEDRIVIILRSLALNAFVTGAFYGAPTDEIPAEVHEKTHVEGADDRAIGTRSIFVKGGTKTAVGGMSTREIRYFVNEMLRATDGSLGKFMNQFPSELLAAVSLIFIENGHVTERVKSLITGDDEDMADYMVLMAMGVAAGFAIGFNMSEKKED